MPIYEYKCTECNNEFECLIIGSDNDVSCPECSGEKVERLMSACRHKSGGDVPSSAAPSGGCAGCSSSNCSTCH